MSRRFDTSNPDSRERLSLWLYGLMVTGATLAAGAAIDGLGRLVLLVVATNVVYYLTHLFASWLAPAPDDGRNALRHHAWVAAPMVSAVFLPIVVTLVAATLGAGQSTAVICGLVTVMLGFAGAAVMAMRGRGLSGVRVAVAAAFVVAVAGLLIGAKLALH